MVVFSETFVACKKKGMLHPHPAMNRLQMVATHSNMRWSRGPCIEYTIIVGTERGLYKKQFSITLEYGKVTRRIV